MKRIVFGLSLLLQSVLILSAAAAHQLKTWNYTSKAQARYSYTYPEVVGKPAISQKLKAAFLPSPGHIQEMDDFLKEMRAENIPDLPEPVSYSEEIEATVTLETPKVISVYYLGLGMLVPSAHPTKIIGARTFDLQSGKELKLKDILKPGALPKVKAEALKALQPILETTDIPEVSQAKDFDFYLTPDKLVLINLFESHAVASVEAEIPRQRLKGLLLY